VSERVWGEGEFVRREHEGITVYGSVSASACNGELLVVEFDDAKTGRSGRMPLAWDPARSTFIGPCGHGVTLHDPGKPSMSQWIVYHGAADHPPDAWVVRRWDIYPNACLPARESAVCESLDAARERVPEGLALLSRHPSDDPAVHEVWI
jgi:hypothetical protein